MTIPKGDIGVTSCFNITVDADNDNFTLVINATSLPARVIRANPYITDIFIMDDECK